jgi:hypothetical protein
MLVYFFLHKQRIGVCARFNDLVGSGKRATALYHSHDSKRAKCLEISTGSDHERIGCFYASKAEACDVPRLSCLSRILSIRYRLPCLIFTANGVTQKGLERVEVSSPTMSEGNRITKGPPKAIQKSKSKRKSEAVRT